MKKMTTFVCVAAITASLLAGCGSKTAETTAASTEAAAATEAASTEAAVEGTDADKEAAKKVADLIDAIYVQERNDNTDEQCKEAKAAWDALTDAQKELVEGENADPDYFGRDTGDASKDDPRNQDDIGENELLVVSFGTSFNDSRVKDIKGIEDALQEANPDWSVRRAFTAQIIINHVEARDGECIDNMDQALERAVANNVKNLVVQPTHLMHGAEYDELTAAVEKYQDKFESVNYWVKLVMMRQWLMMTRKQLQKPLQQKQLRQRIMIPWKQRRKTAQHLYSWVMVHLIQRRFLTARCRPRCRNLVMKMSLSVPLKVNRKTQHVKQSLKQ